jgi:hypothetical protein
LQLVGANPSAPAIGQDELITKTNYFLGSDPSQWRTNVPNFGRVEYQNVYPGVNLVYYGNQGQLEYDFVVAPGADPGTITLSVQGTQGLGLDGQGNLVLHAGGGDIVEQAPVLYQENAGVHQAVSGRFVLEGKNLVGFQVGAYDPSRPLVIDPVVSLSCSTYLGGSGGAWGYGIAVDGSGNAYVTGGAENNFPTTSGAFQSMLQGTEDAFVSKLNLNATSPATALLYSTYLGGSNRTSGTLALTVGFGIAVDGAGNAYVTGSTNTSDFPITSGAYQTTYVGNGSQKAFVTKLDATGSTLLYSTYLGGNGVDGISLGTVVGTIAVDGSGNAYVAGPTTSTDFPTTKTTASTTTAAAYPTWNPSWGSAGYVTEINTSRSGLASLVYSTYLPGGPGSGIALGAGEVYVTGGGGSAFPTTSNAFQTRDLHFPGRIDR